MYCPPCATNWSAALQINWGHTEFNRLLLERDTDLAAGENITIPQLHYGTVKGHAGVTK